MTSHSKPRRRTTLVPVTTMEEFPVLNERERAELLDTLKQAQREAETGKGQDYAPRRFRDRLVRIYRNKKR